MASQLAAGFFASELANPQQAATPNGQTDRDRLSNRGNTDYSRRPVVDRIICPFEPEADAMSSTKFDPTSTAEPTGEVRLNQCACGKHFECGSRTGACWCARFPHIFSVPTNDDNAACLCPQCLQQRIVEQQQQQGG